MNNFYSPMEVKPLFGQIVPAYQSAFADEPWKEVSKCADIQLRCVGGLSELAIGQLCLTCNECPIRQAYEEDELVERFEAIAASRPTAWYVEQNEVGLTLAAIAWKALPSLIADEKYADVPEMKNWLTRNLDSDKPIMWLDEVFANKRLKPKGNLQNFGKFVIGLADILDVEQVAYRTIEPRMTGVAVRDFAEDVTIFRRTINVPDRRDFVILNMRSQA